VCYVFYVGDDVERERKLTELMDVFDKFTQLRARG